LTFACKYQLLIAVTWVVVPLNAAADGSRLAPSGKEFVDVLRVATAKSAAGQWSDAARQWQRVVEINPVNEEYWQRLADAHYKSGEFRQAILAFEKVLDLGGYCFPSETAYSIARSFASLGDKAQALKWLQSAFAMGYRDLDHAKNDPLFKTLHDDPQFLALVGPFDTTKMSRDEGWRSDLSLLQKELERKSYPQFVKLSKGELESEVARLSREIPNLSDVQVSIQFMKLAAKIGVGHTEALPLSNPEFAQKLPLKFFLFKEGLYIVAADPKYQDLLGAQVLNFGDATAKQAMTAIDSVVFKDNANWVNAIGPYLLRYTTLLKGLNLVSDSSHVPLTIRDSEGRTRTVTVNADASYPEIWNIYPYPKSWVGFPRGEDGPLPLYTRHMDALYWFEYLPEHRTVYFQYNRVLSDPEEPFDKFVERLFTFIEQHEVEKLVIDLRWNNGGNTYLLPPLIHALVSSSKINREGGLFVIIGRRTFSAAQNAASYIQRDTRAIFVGEPTGGKPNSLGDETYVTLPHSKILASVADVYWEGSWPQDFRNWVAPQIFIEPTFQDYRSKQDPALDTILTFGQPDFTISQHPGFWCKAENNGR
jgi:tetratricopeptide (TPR) repeat protein